MFYCESCRVKQHWPESLFKSHGPCEICEVVAVCHDRPSSSLPAPEPAPQDDVIVPREAVELLTRAHLVRREDIDWAVQRVPGEMFATDAEYLAAWDALRRALLGAPTRGSK